LGRHRRHDVKLRRVRCACIDIGSNTTRLLVAEHDNGTLLEVVAQRVFTRIGAGRGVEDPIGPDKIADVARVVAGQASTARECGAGSIRVVATAAIRAAPNRDELAAAVARASGLEMHILPAEEEARLAFAGATRTLEKPPAGEIGVVDVGGGSSELVCGTLADGVSWCVSLAIGSGLLADRHLHSDPPSAAELDEVRADIAAAFDGMSAPRPDAAYAVGGSATSLRRLLGAELTHGALDAGLRLLSAAPIDEVARRFDLHAERVRILPAGMILLQAAGDVFGATLRIGRGGLREGVVLEDLDR
jgi:exopolyphosphatase / guanosine-5'-triphosphate,3'-diphosphate pyrophosphatase